MALPGGGLGLGGGEGGAAAGGAFLAGGAGVAGEFAASMAVSSTAPRTARRVEDAPAQFGVEFGAAGDGVVAEPVLEGVGLGGASMKGAYGGEAQAGVGAGVLPWSLGAAQQVAAEGGEGGEGGGAVVGGEVAVGDVVGGEGEDALDEGEVGLVGEVGAGGGRGRRRGRVRRRGPCRGRCSRGRRG